MKQIYPLKARQLAALILSISSIFCNIANAQMESFVIEDTSLYLMRDSKIRYVNDTIALGYYQVSKNGYFTLIDLKNAIITHKVVIDTDFFLINDFRILNDTVYGCGTRLRDSIWRGTIIRFPVDNVRTAPNKSPNQYVEVDNTTSLTRMIVYKNDALGGTHHIVAIGYKEVVATPYSFKYGRMVDCKSNYYANYQVRVRYDNGTWTEWYDDIVLTNNYVGIIGSVGNYTISLRRTPRFSSNIMTGLIDTIYYYSFNHIEPGSLQHATEMGTDSIATACYVVNSSGQFRTHLRQFNLQTMSMLNGHVIATNTKSEPLELAYNRTRRTYLLLEQLPLGGSSSQYEYQILTQLPSGTLGTKTYYVPSQGFESIASSTNNAEFILAGGNVFAQKTMPLIDPQGTCFNTSSKLLKNLGTVTYSTILDNTTASLHYEEWQSFHFGIATPLIHKKCAIPQ